MSSHIPRIARVSAVSSSSAGPFGKTNPVRELGGLAICGGLFAIYVVVSVIALLIDLKNRTR